MKTILSFLIITIIGCKPNINNNAETLDKVFSKEKIEIVIKSRSCFSKGDYFFTLKKEHENYRLFFEKGTLIVTSDSVKSFKNFMLNTFNSKQDGFCTSTDYIKVGDYFNAVDYKDSTCSDSRMFTIIPFYSLIENEKNE